MVQLRKLSAAAEQLSPTQSAVSVLIRQIEKGLGARLFDCTTVAGAHAGRAREAIVVAERVLRDVDSLGEGLRDLTGLRRRPVCLAGDAHAGGDPAAVAAVARLARCTPRSARYRRLRARPVCEPGAGRVRGLGIGTPERGADVATETLVRDQLALVCRRDHRWAAPNRSAGGPGRPPDHHGAAGLRHPAADRQSTAAGRGAAAVVNENAVLHRTVDDQRRAGSVHHAVGLPRAPATRRWWSRSLVVPACHATFRW